MISTTLPPPSGCGLLEDVDELTKLVVRLIPRDDLLAVDAAWLVSCLLCAVDVPFDASNAECMATLEGLRMLRDHGILAVTAVCMVAEATELLTACFDDAVHEQDLDKDLAVLHCEVVVQVVFGLVVCPGEPFAEPVKALEVEWWGFLAGMACTGSMDGIVLGDIFVGRETSGRRRLVVGEVDVVTSWPCRDSGFGHDLERVRGERVGGRESSIRGRGG